MSFYAQMLGQVGSLMGGIGSSAYNMKIAKRQFAFQERMSNTAYQRSMADMRKAGLNPMLVAKLGGASTPPGASIPVQNVVDTAINTGKDVSIAGSQKQKIIADTVLSTQMAKKAVEDTAVSASQKSKLDAETYLLKKGNPRGELTEDLFKKAQEMLGGKGQALRRAIDNQVNAKRNDGRSRHIKPDRDIFGKYPKGSKSHRLIKKKKRPSTASNYMWPYK